MSSKQEIWLDCMPLYRTSKLTCHLGKEIPLEVLSLSLSFSSDHNSLA